MHSAGRCILKNRNSGSCIKNQNRGDPPFRLIERRRSPACACPPVQDSCSSTYLQRMNLSTCQHEAEVHRDWTSRKAAGKSRLEDALAATLSEFERRNGVIVFFLHGSHPLLYLRHAP